VEVEMVLRQAQQVQHQQVLPTQVVEVVGQVLMEMEVELVVQE
jgi:hypothetical protein